MGKTSKTALSSSNANQPNSCAKQSTPAHYENDEQLVAACNDGDRLAMTSLIKQYEKTVYNAAFRIVGNSSDAQDVAQTVFLKVLKNIHTFNPKYRLFSWVYRITINESLNFNDKRKNHGDFHEERHSNYDDQHSNHKGQHSSNPEKAYDNDLLGRDLNSALMQLSTEYRSVVVLKHIAGCSYSEISEILETPEKTVRSRLYSARQQLKELLQGSKQEHLN